MAKKKSEETTTETKPATTEEENQFSSFLSDDSEDDDLSDVDTSFADEGEQPPGGGSTSKEAAEDGTAAASQGAEVAEETAAEPKAADTQPSSSEEASTAGAKEEPKTEAEAKPKEASAPDAAEAAVELTEEERRQQIEQYKSSALEKMAGYFQMSEDDFAEFENDPRSALPKLAARVMYETVQVTAQAVMAQLPQVVQQIETQRSTTSEAEQKFFEAWPQLKGHESVVAQHAQLYRQMHPQAKLEDVIRDVGASATVALKLPFEQPATARSNGDASQNAAGEASPRSGLPPHRPAAAAAPREMGQQRPANPFEQMAAEYAAGEDDF